MIATLKRNAEWICIVGYICIGLLTATWRYQRPLPGENMEQTFYVSYFAGAGWPIYWAARGAEWITIP